MYLFISFLQTCFIDCLLYCFCFILISHLSSRLSTHVHIPLYPSRDDSAYFVRQQHGLSEDLYSKIPKRFPGACHSLQPVCETTESFGLIFILQSFDPFSVIVFLCLLSQAPEDPSLCLVSFLRLSCYFLLDWNANPTSPLYK